MKKFFFIVSSLFCYLQLQAQAINKDILAGNEAYKKGAFAQAATQYQQALKMDAHNLIANFNFANSSYKQNRFTEANEHYKSIIQQSTDKNIRAKAWYNLGNAFIKQQMLNEAIYAYRQNLLLTPDDNDARENLQKAMQEKSRQNNQRNPNKKADTKQAKNPLNPALAEQYMQQLREQEKQLQKQLQISPVSGQREKDW